MKALCSGVVIGPTLLMQLNNKNPKEYWVNVVPEDFKKSYPEDGFFTIAGSGEKKKWSDITRNEDFTEPKNGWKVASASDYQALFVVMI